MRLEHPHVAQLR